VFTLLAPGPLFVQAEDGIRYRNVTGVQTCALPIFSGVGGGKFAPDASITREQLAAMLYRAAGSPEVQETTLTFNDASKVSSYARSEERRVGKECRSRRSTYDENEMRSTNVERRRDG